MKRNRSKTHPLRSRQTKKLSSLHLHIWSRAFSPRRLSDADCFVVRIPKGRPVANVGGHGALTGPGLEDA